MKKILRHRGKEGIYDAAYGEDAADRALCLLFCHVFVCLFVLQIFTGLSYLRIGSQHMASLACKASIGLGFAVCAPALAARVSPTGVRAILTALAVALWHWLCFPANRSVFAEIASSFFTICLPLFVCAGAIRNGARLFFYMTKTARIIAWATALFYPAFALFFTGYSMSFSYALMAPCMTLCVSFLQNRCKRDLLLGLVLLSAMVSYGSRGALLCTAVWAVFLLIRKIGSGQKERAVLMGLGLLGIAAIAAPGIGPVLRTWLATQDIRSRTLRLMMQDTMHLSGRDALYGQIAQAFRTSPLVMRGIGADRIFLGQYAHNFILELLYEGGLLLGLPLVLILFKFSWQTVKRGLSGDADPWPLLFFCASIPSLMVSSSLWHNMYFWIWLAFCAKNRRTTAADNAYERAGR